MSKGVVYWNGGTKLLVRLYVSLISIREVYNGNLTVILNYDVPNEFDEILKENGFDTIRIRMPDHEAGKHKSALLGKTIINKHTPYDTTVLIDCDTLVLREFEEMFTWADQHSFVVTQFSNWGTARGRIAKRIRQWGPEPDGLGILAQEDINAALEYGKGINVGVYSFKKDATIFDDWHDLAQRGMNTFIPDEVSCQILLPKHKHFCAPQQFNSSCKYSKVTEDTKIIHYHGRKHASVDKTRNTGTAGMWIDKYRQLIRNGSDMRVIAENWPDRWAKKLNI